MSQKVALVPARAAGQVLARSSRTSAQAGFLTFLATAAAFVWPERDDAATRRAPAGIGSARGPRVRGLGSAIERFAPTPFTVEAP